MNVRKRSLKSKNEEFTKSRSNDRKSSYSIETYSIKRSNGQKINDCQRANMKNKLEPRYSLRSSVKSKNEKFPKSLKSRSDLEISSKESDILNGSKSSDSLRSHSVKRSTGQKVNHSQGENAIFESEPRYSSRSIRYSLRSSPKSTKKEDFLYNGQSKQLKNSSEKLVAKIIKGTSTRISNKLGIKENSFPKASTRYRDVYGIERKIKLEKNRCDKLQKTKRKKLSGSKQLQKGKTKETNLSKSRSTPKLKEALRNDIIENDSKSVSFNEEGLLSFKKFQKPKTKKKNYCAVKCQRKDSFEKYGILFPSYEDVLDNINKVKEEANALDAYEKEYGNLDNSPPQALEIIDNAELHVEENLKDCQDLSVKKLQEYFQQNLEYTTSIINGESNSQRHEKFINYDPRNRLTMADLTYCPSIVVFTGNQRELLLKLLEDQFDPNCEKTDYLFKVLLPELCLKIFMDVHGMTENDALDYLNWRPLE